MRIDLTLILQLVSFGILLFLLNKFVLGQVITMLDQRRESIRKKLDEADRLQRQAEEERKKAEAQLLETKKQALAIKEEAFAYGERLKEEQQSQARQEAERIREKAVKDLDLYVAKVKDELKRLSGELSFEIASKILAKEVDKKKHKQLVEESLKVLYEQGNNYL